MFMKQPTIIEKDRLDREELEKFTQEFFFQEHSGRISDDLMRKIKRMEEVEIIT